ncbi:hypothetical protein SBV1_1340009 [Verrucomicrobia bacterium]|nr:hypothetical protein SBV1_1340009 [Verrucomicrobiota bacterium]
MTEPEKTSIPEASVEEIRQSWHGLILKIRELEAQEAVLEHENKALRSLLERVIDHRQKSHSELVLLLTGLVSKLPINEIAVIVSKLVEHNTNVSQTLAAFVKGTAEPLLSQPAILQTLDQTKRDLVAAIKPLVEELLRLETPLEPELLQTVAAQPESFLAPRAVRATRCFVKGQVPRERILKEFGLEALIFFNDMTTDAKLNPRPRPEEIALAFKSDFETLLQQHPEVPPQRRQDLIALHQRIQHSKSPGEQARAQKSAFQKLSFLIELLHYYENQNTEAPEPVFAQRLPSLVEQLALAGPHVGLDEKLLQMVEHLISFVINPDHRQVIVNNIGKGGDAGKTLKYVLKLRSEKAADPDHVVAEFVKHLLPASPAKAPTPVALAALMRLIHPEMQRRVVKAILTSDRMRKEDAQNLSKAVAVELGLKDLEEPSKAQQALPPDVERRIAWGEIKDLINRRSEASTVAAAIRNRLHTKYDADEIKQSWITLTEADPISLIRIVCQVPYLANGSTDTIARTLVESYVTRLTHEKYSATYHKVVNSLRNMFNAKPDSPTLLNFLALTRWVSPEAANRLCTEIGMPIPP